MYIDKKSPVPIYFQLKNIILDKITKGEYTEGSVIPSERELVDVLNISRMTVRQAINHLVNEGFLFREKGKGTFVSRTKIEQKNIMSFSDIVSTKGRIPSTKILYFNREIASKEIQGLLSLNENVIIYKIKRLRLADQIPVGIEENFIPEMYCPGLEKYDLTSSLYKLMKEEYSHEIKYVDNVVEAAKPSREEKELLNITGNIPVLNITSVLVTASDLKLQYERSTYRADEYKYNIRVYGN